MLCFVFLVFGSMPCSLQYFVSRMMNVLSDVENAKFFHDMLHDQIADTAIREDYGLNKNAYNPSIKRNVILIHVFVQFID